MMKNTLTTLLVIVLAGVCAISSCTGPGLRRRPGYDGPVTEKYTENPNWTMTYTDRSVDTNNGIYVVDVINMFSSDDKSYYIDLVSLKDYRSLYKANVVNFIQGSAKNLDKNFIEQGDSRAVFDALDAGDGSWVAVAYEVDEQGVPGHDYSILFFETKAITMRQDKSYEISYDGREMREDDLGVFEADIIKVKSHSDYSYYIDISYPEYINENYDGNPVNFFNDVLDGLAGQLSEGEDFTRYLYESDAEVAFESLRHGDWTAYAFGVDYLGNLTGNWSEIKFDIEEETPTEDFKKWLGKWAIGSDGIFYNITISSAEANHFYAIEDWETGNDASEFANQEAKNYVFEASYDENSKNLVFTSQYLGSFTDDSIGDFDVCFMGNVQYDDQLLSITDINTPIATAKLDADGKSADVTAEYVTIEQNGNYTTTFVSMQFIDMTETDLYTYNDDIPSFPMKMTKISDVSPVAAIDPLSRSIPARRVSRGNASVSTKDKGDIRTVSGRTVRSVSPDAKPLTKAQSTDTQKTAGNARPNNQQHR